MDNSEYCEVVRGSLKLKKDSKRYWKILYSSKKKAAPQSINISEEKQKAKAPIKTATEIAFETVQNERVCVLIKGNSKSNENGGENTSWTR